MRKQAYYLPTLNELLFKNREYMRHREKIRLTKSEYQMNAFTALKFRKQAASMQDQIKKLSNLESKPSPNLTLEINEGTSTIEKRYRFNPSPYQRRKLQQQQRQNLRLSKAMELSNPAINAYEPKSYSNYSAAKERMKYYTHDAGKVVCKFQKSLAEIQKKRRKNEEEGSNRSKNRKEKAKERLQALLQESSQLIHMPKASVTLPNDIFYNDGESIRLPSCSSSLQIKQTPPKKHSHLHTVNESLTNREYYRKLAIYSSNNTIQNKSKKSKYKNKIKDIRKKILVKSSLNPQRALSKQKQAYDMEIVSMVPTSNQS